MIDEPFWKSLFAPGSFEWAFRMRKGDACSFFATRDPEGRLLEERRKRLDRHPERYSSVTPRGEALVDAVWDLALGWEQVSEPENGERGICALSRQWEADLLLMDLETRTLAAGAVCFPSSWDLKNATGKTLDAVHGMVPRLNPQIGEMIDRFLQKLLPGKAFRRENWSLTRTAEPDYHPDLNRQRLDETVTLDEIFLRVEQQLFTGIPGGVLMGLRIESCPLADLAADPDAWQNIMEKVRTMPEDVARYKAMDSAIDAIVRGMKSHQG